MITTFTNSYMEYLNIFTIYKTTVFLLAMNVLIQWLEYFSLQKVFKKNGSVQEIKYIDHIIFLGISSSVLLVFYPFLSVVLIFLYGLIFISHRQHFNGGSDSMTIILLLSVFISSIWKQEWILQACLLMIGIQGILSYLVAGIAKVKNPKWRNGSAIIQFFEKSNYYIDPNIKQFVLSENNKPFVRLINWFILFFELTFPFAIFNTKICLIYLLVGFFFHLFNAKALGLNRFLFTWICTYPSILWMSTISKNF